MHNNYKAKIAITACGRLTLLIKSNGFDTNGKFLMKIETENGVTPSAAKWLRNREGMTLSEFWGSVTSTAASGSRYEAGDAVPQHLRRLIFLTYVAKLPTDTSDSAGGARAIHAGHLFHIDLAGGKETIAQVITETMAQLRKASRALGL